MKLQVEVPDELAKKFRVYATFNKETQSKMIEKILEDFFAKDKMAETIKELYQTTFENKNQTNNKG